MAKFKISKDIQNDPINPEIIGKSIHDVDAAIREYCPVTYQTDAKGENGHRCLTYQYDMLKALLIVDKDDRIIDYFVYQIGQETPENPNA
ncbi:MAG: hypothetical protein IKS22_09195 [Bacteroidales bacterium]|nr:hypothetical protein [Bacteroidales bacterium]